MHVLAHYRLTDGKPTGYRIYPFKGNRQRWLLFNPEQQTFSLSPMIDLTNSDGPALIAALDRIEATIKMPAGDFRVRLIYEVELGSGMLGKTPTGQYIHIGTLDDDFTVRIGDNIKPDDDADTVHLELSLMSEVIELVEQAGGNAIHWAISLSNKWQFLPSSPDSAE